MITLSAITGNEEAVIERFIRSFAPAVDTFVLVRAIGTLTPDNTFDIAERVCHELHKPITLECYRNEKAWPHVDDYAAARNLALEIAMDECADGDEYILWSDCDDILAPDAADVIRAAAASQSHELFLMPYHVRGDKQVVMRERMFRVDTMPRWKFPIHEQIEFGKELHYKILQDAVFLHQPLAGKSPVSERNIRILSAAVATVGRNFFYLAQQYFEARNDGAFVRAATAALACKDLSDIESYELHIQLAQTPHQDSRTHAAQAFAIMPDRREALALLASYCLIDKDHEKALTLATRMINTPLPNRTYWSQNLEWYGWKGRSLYCQCRKLAGLPPTVATADDSPPIFSIIHATLGRPEQALAIREMWLSAARHPERVEYIFGIHDHDARSRELLAGFPHTVTDQSGPGWNYDTAAGLATGQIIIQAQDDCYPPEGWDEALLALIPDPANPVFVAVGDGHRQDRLCVNTVMTAAYMAIKAARDPGENGFFHRGYPTVYADTENSFRAIQDGKAGICRYVDAQDFIIYHDHPFFAPGVPMDATYTLENHPKNYAEGEKLFAERNPDAKPDCFERGGQ